MTVVASIHTGQYLSGCLLAACAQNSQASASDRSWEGSWETQATQYERACKDDQLYAIDQANIASSKGEQVEAMALQLPLSRIKNICVVRTSLATCMVEHTDRTGCAGPAAAMEFQSSLW